MQEMVKTQTMISKTMIEVAKAQGAKDSEWCEAKPLLWMCVFSGSIEVEDLAHWHGVLQEHPCNVGSA